MCSPLFSGFISINFIYSFTSTLDKQAQILIAFINNRFFTLMASNSWKARKTIPSLDLEKSLECMDQHQIDVNIVEIKLLALKNENILKWLQIQMHRNQFFLKYRYVLENVLNGKLSEETKKNLGIALAKFDQSFINGPKDMQYSEKAILQMPISKEKKLKFVGDEEVIIHLFEDISLNLFRIEDGMEKRSYFDQQLHNINKILQTQEEVDENSDFKPTLLKGFIFCQGFQLRKVVNINVKNSFFIQTRNRSPLVLDFQFGRFLYKIDDQLAHELIAMEFIKYFNTILGKEYILPYQIIPFKTGALYEFVNNAFTIHQIKASHEQHGLVQYMQKLCKEGNREQIMNRFAESYSGFCLIQHMLDIKDRNNCNIMIKTDGTIFHIDLAFIFGSGPGGMKFESAPFKMTKEMVKIFGGFQSDAFKKYETLMIQHFTKLLECKQQLMWKLEVFEVRHKEILCFKDFKHEHYAKKLPKKLSKVKQFVQELIDASYDSWKTTKYDDFQFKSNNILR